MRNENLAKTQNPKGLANLKKRVFPSIELMKSLCRTRKT